MTIGTPTDDKRSESRGSPRDIELYTAPTPNGWKVAIALEELGLEYRVHHVRLADGEQHTEGYRRINPNGRIPAIVDHGNGGLAVFESGAILWYLAQRMGRLLPESPAGQIEALQWLMLQMSGVGPMMGQAAYFRRVLAPTGVVVPVAIDRYTQESRRLLEVLDTRLRDREYVVGQQLSIVDIAFYPWARSHFWSGVSVSGLDALRAWLGRLGERPSVVRGCAVPERFPAAFGEGDIEAAMQVNVSRFGTAQTGSR